MSRSLNRRALIKTGFGALAAPAILNVIPVNAQSRVIKIGHDLKPDITVRLLYRPTVPLAIFPANLSRRIAAASSGLFWPSANL